MSAKAKSKQNDDYEVGYGKPPKNTRFKPGRSGNPKGRPKQKKTATSILNSLLAKKVAVRTKDSVEKVPLLEAMLHQQVTKALQGDQKAVSFILKYLNENGHLSEEPEQTGGIIAVPIRTLNEQEFQLNFGGNRSAEEKAREQKYIDNALESYEDRFGPFTRSNSKA